MVVRGLFWAPLLVGLAACSHANEGADKGAPSASASSAAPAPSAPEPAPRAEEPAPVEDPGPPIPAAEVRRTTLRSLADDKALAPHEAVLLAHFGKTIPFPLAVQEAPVAGGGRALLFQKSGKDRDPFILVLDAAGQALWIKERPLAGIVPGITEMVLVPTAKGDVVLSWYDGPSKIIAARHWDALGSILVDFPLMHADACAALTGLHWPGKGFVIAAATAGAARVQLLTDAGTLAFGGDGVELPWTSHADAPVSISVAAGRGVTFFQAGHADAATPGAPLNHMLAARFDAHGKALWPKPLVIGYAAPGRPGEHIELTMVNNGNTIVPSLRQLVTPEGSVVSVAPKR